MGIMISHYKDPYQTTSIMESKRVFFVAHVYICMYIYIYIKYIQVAYLSCRITTRVCYNTQKTPHVWKGFGSVIFSRMVLQVDAQMSYHIVWA